MQKQEILIDRSRYETLFTCPRLYYWQYVYGGHGIQTVGNPVYFAVGETVHVGVQASMLELSWPITIQKMREAWDAHTLLTDGSETLHQDQRDEQWDLAVALVYVWRLQRLPFFLQEYRVYNGLIEQEINIPVYENDKYIVKGMFRPDVLVQRLSDSKILLWELKTVGMVTQQWIKRWTHALQLMLQMYAAEQFLRARGDDSQIAGIVVEGLVKGIRRRDDTGIKRQSSSLIYAYGKEGDGYIVKDQLSHVWRKGWTRCLVSTKMAVEQWIQQLPVEELQKSVALVPPLLYDQETVQSVLKQVGCRAIETFERIGKSVNRSGGNIDIDMLDTYWPQSFNSCHEFDDCHFLDACFSPAVQESPLESGLFVPRVPNHEYEKEVISA